MYSIPPRVGETSVATLGLHARVLVTRRYRSGVTEFVNNNKLAPLCEGNLLYMLVQV